MDNFSGKEGLYYLLNTDSLQAKIRQLGLCDKAVYSKADSAKIARLMAQSISEDIEAFIQSKLDAVAEDPENPPSISDILADLPTDNDIQQTLQAAIPCDKQVLTEIKKLPSASKRIRPTTELTESAIIVPDGHSPQLGNEISRELASCAHVDWLVSFIKLKAINSFYPQLLNYCQTPNPDGSPRLRIATTTYCGATDAKALKLLFSLPNTEIKVSFNASNTRLHAKAYIFMRNSGFGSAYVGSANLSTAAMSSGMEWTVKIAQKEMPYLWRRAIQAFESCWNNDDFEKCTEKDLQRINDTLKQSKIKYVQDQQKNTSDIQRLVLRPHPFQKEFLDKLATEREIEKKNRHLLVSATGTGKTMVAAFDYASACKGGSMPTLLYIAHRKDILEHAIQSYRAVLGNDNWGYVSTEEDTGNNSYRQIFCTVATWKSKFRDELPHDFFRHIVVDECHHTSEDGSYKDFIGYYSSVIDSGKTDLLGLTATPFRTDGYDIRQDFGGNMTHELSLSEAIENGHIVPFTYFGVDDVIDYSEINWALPGQADREIENLLKNNGQHFQHVYNTLADHVNDLNSLRAIGFCAGIEHAKSICSYMNAHGIPSITLTGKSSMEEREKAMNAMAEVPSKIKIIFTADLFNEGVDIPCVNTELMLRPTNSPLIFIQQLGRGLRQAPLQYGKEDLLILDFVGNHNNKYKGFLRFQALSSRKDIPIQRQIENGMPFVPSGCSITLSQKSKEMVLKNIKAHMDGLKGQALKKTLLNAIRENDGYMSLNKMMDFLACESPSPIYNVGTPGSLANESLGGVSINYPEGKFFNSLSQNNSPFILNCWRRLLNKEIIQELTADEIRIAKFFLISVFNPKAKLQNTDELWNRMTGANSVLQDLKEFLDWRCTTLAPQKSTVFPQTTRFLELHRSYSTKQISACIGGNGLVLMSGTYYNSQRDLDAFFITINKSDKDFSPSTMYHDYAKMQRIFHWESPGRTRVGSKEGQRYIRGTSTKMLFIRQAKRIQLDVTGQYNIGNLTSNYIFLGPVKSLLNHENECPIEFDWELEYDMPCEIFDFAKCC